MRRWKRLLNGAFLRTAPRAPSWSVWQPLRRDRTGLRRLLLQRRLAREQEAERILFSVNGDGTVTAVVQVLYEGPSEKSAWVLPVPGSPEVEVSSDLALQRLQSATNPS